MTVLCASYSLDGSRGGVGRSGATIGFGVSTGAEVSGEIDEGCVGIGGAGVIGFGAGSATAGVSTRGWSGVTTIDPAAELGGGTDSFGGGGDEGAIEMR
jgi:hypothetical protein